MAVHLLNAIENEFKKRIPLTSLFHSGTIAAQAILMRGLPDIQSPKASLEPIIHIREGGQSSLLAVHPVGGNILCYKPLSNLIPQGVSILGIQSPGTGQPRSLTQMASDYVTSVKTHITRNQGLHLLGWSMGGVIAHDMVRILEASNYRVSSLTMVDSWIGDTRKTGSPISDFELLKNFVGDFLDGASISAVMDEVEKLEVDRQIDAATRILRAEGMLQPEVSDQLFLGLLAEYSANYRALISHRAGRVKTNVRMYRATRVFDRFPYLTPFDLHLADQRDALGNSILELNEDHFSIIREKSLKRIVAEIPW